MQIHLLSYLIVILGAVNLLRMATFLICSDIYGLLQAKRKKNSQSHTPRVSVVIPGYNEEGTILKAIESILQSDYPINKLEIVVIDDGSKDNTSKVVKKYVALHKKAKIKLITQKNSGKARALNNGIKNYCTGKLVMCLDADSSLDRLAIKNAALYFADPQVMALSANVKVVREKGLLNLLQLYEYLVCYQMKRAESLINCEYIVGGIGSIFRRSVLLRVGFYDTNTVTEDIDLTMKILQLGNKKHKVIYGADVVAYTGSVLSIPDLIKQRYRWKWGRSQTFLKNVNMFFSRDKKFTKSLSWFYLPYALYGEVAYFIEPLLLTYVLGITIYYRNPMTIISAWLIITAYISFNIFAEDTISLKDKLKLAILAPFMYGLFYILSFVEYVALIKVLLKIRTLKSSLSDNICGWTHVKRSVHQSAVYLLLFALSQIRPELLLL